MEKTYDPFKWSGSPQFVHKGVIIMRYKTLWFIMTCIISVIIVSEAWADRDKPDPSSDTLYFEDYVQAIEDEPENRFHRAREYFFKDDMEAAAREIRKAAVFLRLELGWATKEGKKGLITSALELDELADEVQKVKVASVKELDDAFSLAHYALARHYHLKASESSVKEAYGNLVRELKSAVKHLKHALLWNGDKIESAFKEMIKDIHMMEKKFVGGEKQDQEQAGKILESIGQEIERSGQKTEPKKGK